MLPILQGIFYFCVAVMLAVLEIQIEGRNGWAKNLPCWRPKNQNNWLIKLVNKATEGRGITGYHIAYVLSVILLLHLPFFYFGFWNFAAEIWVFAIYTLLMLAEDFLWFVLNPSFGIDNFKKSQIPWHPHWVGRIPTLYFGLIGSSFILMLISAIFGGISYFVNWAVILVVMGALTAITSLIFGLRKK